jgi:L-alanine-DL-glutamate epimerase-like enolase superfamily enzyme
MAVTNTDPAGPTRLAHARVRTLAAEVDDGIAMSFAPLRRRSMVMVELATEDGRVGRGESWVNFPSWAPVERVVTLTEGVLPLLRERDLNQISLLHHDLLAALEPVGRQWGARGPIRQAISAVDVALWDLRAQQLGIPIHGLLGGLVRDEIPVYASSLGPDGVAELAARCRDAGFRALKVKLGFGRETDDRNLATVRKICGPDMVVHADANQGWTLAEAIAAAPMLREHGVGWIEEPVRGDALADLERLYERTGLLIATGENLYGCAEFEPYARSEAVQVLQPDIAKTGGLTEALGVCALAASHGKQVAPHLYGGALGFLATLQLAAAALQVTTVEYDVRSNPLRDPLLDPAPAPVAGVLAIPSGPGLGVALNHQAVQTFSEVIA